MRASRLVVLAFFAVLSAAGSLCAAPALTSLPAKFQGKDVFLLVAIDGHRPLWMKLDIDGAPSSVSPRAAGLRGAPDATLRIGSVGLSHVALRTETAPPPNGPDGKPLAGVLGIDALGNRPLWIDTKRKQVWISEPVPSQPLRTAGLSR